MAFAFVGVVCSLQAVELPANAVAVEYVQGNGTDAYMNTGWTVNPQTDVIELEFALTSRQADETVLCARGTSSFDRSVALWYLGPTEKFRWNYNSAGTDFSSVKPLEIGVKYNLTLAGGSLCLDNGTRYDHAVASAFTETGGPLHLFCSYYSDKMGTRTFFGTWRLYALKFWRSGELIHDCIPFRNLACTDLGLWDRVEGTAVPHAGDFLSGPEVAREVSVRLPDQEFAGAAGDLEPQLEVRNASGRLLTPGEDYVVDYVPGPLEGQRRAHVACLQGSGVFGVTNVDFAVRRPVPSTYERLEYIQGDGASWMLTDYVPNPQTDVLSLEYSLRAVETTALLCARANNAGNTWSFCTINNQYRFDYMSVVGNQMPGSRILPDTKYTVTLSNNVATVSGNYSRTMTLNTSFTSTSNPLGFYAFYVSGPNSGNRNTVSYHKTYVCRAWRAGALIHEWVPVRRIGDGVVTLYDTVAQQALTPQHAGTGAFLAGPVLPTPERPVTIAAIPVQELTGADCTPALEVRDPVDGHVLTEGSDYTVAYADNDAAGVATAMVTGQGDYAGISRAVPFTIHHPLPTGYERLAYIQGDGRTRLLTDWTVHPEEDRVDTEVEFTKSNVNAIVWCSRGEWTSDRTFTFFQLAEGTFRWDYLSSRTFTRGAGIRTGVRYALRATNRGELYFGDRACAAFPKTVSHAEAAGPLMLFASYYGGTENNINYLSTHRLYGMSVRRDGAPGRVWVPVKDETGVATLYEVVTGTRLAPLGTGAFLAGPRSADFDLYVRDQAWNGVRRIRPRVTATNRVTGVELHEGVDYVTTVTTDTTAGLGTVTATGVEESAYAGQSANTAFEIHATLPEGYSRLRYVQGDGTAYLPTELTPHPTTDRLKLEFELPDDGMSGLFCARASNGDRAWAFCVLPRAPRFRFDFAASNLQSNGYGPVLPNRRYVVDVNGRTCTVSSGENYSVAGKDTVEETGGPLMLLCYYTMQKGVPAIGNVSRAKVYGCRMYRSGALLHDWVPVLTPTGVATLYDLVDQAPLVPGGGETLLAGPVVDYDPPPPAGTVILMR